jgi:hypothetical protein
VSPTRPPPAPPAATDCLLLSAVPMPGIPAESVCCTAVESAAPEVIGGSTVDSELVTKLCKDVACMEALTAAAESLGITDAQLEAAGISRTVCDGSPTTPAATGSDVCTARQMDSFNGCVSSCQQCLPNVQSVNADVGACLLSNTDRISPGLPAAGQIMIRCPAAEAPQCISCPAGQFGQGLDLYQEDSLVPGSSSVITAPLRTLEGAKRHGRTHL